MHSKEKDIVLYLNVTRIVGNLCVSVSSLYHKLIIHNNSSLLCTKEVPQLGQKISTKYKIIGMFETDLQSRRVEWTRKGEKDITTAAPPPSKEGVGGLAATATTTVTKVKQDIREFLSRADRYPEEKGTGRETSRFYCSSPHRTYCRQLSLSRPREPVTDKELEPPDLWTMAAAWA